MPADAQPPAKERPRVLMLGKGWFPDQVGGLDRYFRDLLENQPEATGVVIGPASGNPDRLVAVSDELSPLPSRLLRFGLAARRAARDAASVDAHFALYALAPLLSRRIRALPMVVHFQGPWADENVAQGDDSRLRLALRRAVERIVYRRANRIVVLSSSFRRLLVERYRVSPWRVRVEPPGVDLDRFSPGDREGARARLGLAGCPFLAVCVRRLVPRMGLDVLIDAWARALPELPPQSQLVLTGEGPLRRELEEQVARGGLHDSVRLLGRVDDDALVDLYRAADVGIVPTRSFEGFGLVVIEAAACGTPTIVTQVGGLPEAVAGLDPSLSVPAGDPAALGDRITRAARGALPSRDATRRFAEGYSWERVVERNRALQREALEPAGATRPMRVVYLDHVAQLSGGEIALLRLLPYLRGVEPHVILAEDGPFATELGRAGISTEVMSMAQLARGLRKDRVTPGSVPVGAVLGTVAYVLRLAMHLRRLQPDLVHTNSLKAGVYGSLAARLAGVPVVWHVRDRIAPDYLPRGAVWAVRALARTLPAAVIANSHSTLVTLDPRAQPVIVYSVVPEVVGSPAARDYSAPRSLTVGMVGRFAPWKGQDLFLRAFHEALADGEASCVLVGTALFGEDEFERRLHELAAELGLENRVEFRGFRSDIWSELSRMDILVHASVIPEPFGQVILEGMAAGVPIIAAAAGGPAELINHDVNGVLYPMGDQSSLAETMRKLAMEPGRRQRLIDGGRATAAAHRPGAVAPQIERVYREVIGRAETTADIASSPLTLRGVSLNHEANKLREIESAALSADEPYANRKPFGHFWGSSYFTKWAAISHALFELGLEEGATILDVGMGGGWTTVFLAESGFRPTGIDIAPASVACGQRRAKRCGVAANFVVADMDTLDLGETYDAVLVFDALHHSTRQREVVRRVAEHLKPGGWVLFGEPSWLHSVSPHARRTSRDLGWVERGISVRRLKDDCRRAGLREFRRFYEGTSPFKPSVRGFLWELGRLVGAQINVSPRTSVWLAARRPLRSEAEG